MVNFWLFVIIFGTFLASYLLNKSKIHNYLYQDFRLLYVRKIFHFMAVIMFYYGMKQTVNKI